MKPYFSLLILLCFLNPISSQINGNGNMKSISKKFSNLTSIDVQFNADIILDYAQEEMMVITADENILNYIGIYFEDGSLLLDQKKWIEPSKQPVITIGSPNLQTIFQGTHSTTTVKNAKIEALELLGNVGKIIVEGEVDELFVETENTTLDLQNLKIGRVQINDDCTSKIILNQFDKLVKNDSAKPRIKFMDPTKSDYESNLKEIEDEKVTYIKFKIKNNSIKHNSFYVKGPNGRGGTFSYGFSMLPFTSRAENWSIGTKVFKESRSGKMTELVSINEESEGQVIKLFE